jgi:hypothetical protein
MVGMRLRMEIHPGETWGLDAASYIDTGYPAMKRLGLHPTTGTGMGPSRVPPEPAMRPDTLIDNNG